MILRSAKRFLYYQVEDAVADKFSLLGESGEGTNQGQDNGSLDEGFFEEFSFDDFDYDDIFGSEPDDDPFEPMKEERKVNVQPATPPVPARKEQSAVTPPVKKPAVKEQSVGAPIRMITCIRTRKALLRRRRSNWMIRCSSSSRVRSQRKFSV